MAYGANRLPLRTHKNYDSGTFEVGVSNLWGQIRLEDFMMPPSDVPAEEQEKYCEEYIAYIQAAHERFFQEKEAAKNPPPPPEKKVRKRKTKKVEIPEEVLRDYDNAIAEEIPPEE